MNVTHILDVVLSLVAVFPAIIFHEIAHGRVALQLGDPTAKASGRLTLNPLAHIDPIGTILVPLILVVLRSPFLFGWAKPVPINPGYFRNPFKGMLYVAIAGPLTNVGLALVTAGVGRVLLLGVPDQLILFGTGFSANLVYAVFYLLGMFVIYNVFLAVFNMVPIPPLDGSRVLTYFLPPEGRRIMLSLERFGFILLIALLYFGGLQGLFDVTRGIWQGLLGTHWMYLLLH